MNMFGDIRNGSTRFAGSGGTGSTASDTSKGLGFENYSTTEYDNPYIG